MFTNPFAPTDGLDRRAFLFGVSAAAALLPAGLAAADDAISLSPPPNKMLDTPQGALDTYIKLFGDASGKNYGGMFSGHAFAWTPDACIRPLMGFTGFGLGSDHKQPDGSYHHIWHEVGFYTDLQTGEVLTEWVNPMNGVKCEVMPINNRSVNLVFSPHLADPAKMAAAGYTIMNTNFANPNDPTHPFGMPYALMGDDLTMFADSVGYIINPLDPTVWKKESSGKFLNVGEFNQVTGSRRAVLNPAVTNVPVTGSWTRLGPYLPWMLMGQSPGHLLYRSATKKLRGPQDLPASLVAYTKKNFPAFLEFPTDFSVPIESSWDVYKHTHKPA